MVDTLSMLSGAWAVASALAITAIGVLLLRDREAQPRGALPFGLFAVAWGIQITAINLAGFAPTQAAAEYGFLIAAAAYLPLAYLLVEFAAAYARSDVRSLKWRAIRWSTASLAIGGALAFIFQPSLIFQGVTLSESIFFPQWGPLYDPVVTIVALSAFPIALVAVHNWIRQAPTDRTKRYTTLLAIGLALYTGYNAANNLPFFLPDALGDPISTLGLYAITLSAIVVVCGYLGADAIRQAVQAPTEHDQRRNRWLALAYLLPMVWGLIEGFVSLEVEANIYTVGLWRLAGVAVIAYGIARWRDVRLPQRVRRASSGLLGGSGALAGGASAYAIVSLFAASVIVPAVSAILATALTAVPSFRWARDLFDTDEENPVAEADELYEERVETYRAALEDAMARDSLDEEEPFLESLRERFDISEREDRILRFYARKSTVPRIEGDPDTAYERIRILGEGGAGRTWLARDRSRDRLVVLKEPLEKWHDEPAVLDAARREARLAARVRHPNVVEIEEVLEDQGRPVLVMPYVDGGSLADKLRREGTLSPRETMRLGHDLARGLHAIHEAGIVHRDLTPGNVLLTDDGRALITDFGLARSTDGSDTRLLAEDAGSQPYQAPEAKRGSDDPSQDVYACAAILHACLYGSPPAQGAVRVDVDVPQALQSVVEDGLARDPGQRPDSARAFAEQLEEALP